MKAMEVSVIFCPKCQCNDLIIYEIWTGHSIEFTQDGGLIDLNSGIVEPGNPNHLEAKCRSCKHEWRVRGRNQIGLITKTN